LGSGPTQAVDGGKAAACSAFFFFSISIAASRSRFAFLRSLHTHALQYM
jgi:hypothetical protein